jgi:nucleosome binding factor SPN SPT16 subunit
MERVAKHHRFHLEFDIPYRDLGFHGVPNREMVLIQPTVRCLVNLTETPFFIVELDRVPNQAEWPILIMGSGNVAHRTF